jgi:hypothetical protein
LTNVYPNNNKNNNNKKKNNKVKSKPLELFELAGKKYSNNEYFSKKNIRINIRILPTYPIVDNSSSAKCQFFNVPPVHIMLRDLLTQ